MKVNDKIVFKYNGTTLNYKVVQNIYHNTYYLSGCDVKNDKIFDLLGISDRFSFCSAMVGYTLTNTCVTFPEVKTLEDLEKIVNALYQRIIDISTPKFEEGAIVKILPKDGFSLDYPFGYTSTMEEFANTTTTICGLEKILSVDALKDCIDFEKYEEPFHYVLKGNEFTWASSMLESANEDETKKEEVLPPKFNIGEKVKIKMLDLHRHYGVYLSSDMLQYCGQEFVIVNHRRETKLQNEKCDGYVYSLKNIYGWVWSSDMLEKIDSIVLLPPELPKTDINTQTVTFGNIKTTTGTVSFKEEKDSSIDYKLNFTVDSLDFKK